MGVLKVHPAPYLVFKASSAAAPFPTEVYKKVVSMQPAQVLPPVLARPEVQLVRFPAPEPTLQLIDGNEELGLLVGRQLSPKKVFTPERQVVQLASVGVDNFSRIATLAASVMSRI
jgi:hypothetical protein